MKNQWAPPHHLGERPCWGAWGDGWAATTVGQGPDPWLCHTTRVLPVLFPPPPPPETGLCLFLDKDEHALETHLLIISGEGDSRDSERRGADGQEGVSGKEYVFLGERTDALRWADGGGGVLVLPGSLA